jgi:hypothetical protein
MSLAWNHRRLRAALTWVLATAALLVWGLALSR